MERLYKYLFVLVLFFVAGVEIIFSQVYVKVEDESVKPVALYKAKQGNTFTRIITRNEELNKLLAFYKITKYEQAYPTANGAWLLDIYVMEGDDEIFDVLKKRFSKQFSLIEKTEIQPIEVGSSSFCLPNDYKPSIQTNLSLVRAPETWTLVGNLPRCPIGVTDTHFEETHPDLNGQYIKVIRTNREDKYSFHGTAVSGILGSATDNGVGYSSVSSGAPIYASTQWGDDNEVLRIAQLGYRVINCSWMNRCSYSVIQDSLYSEVKNKWNTVVVFGAGNNSSHCGSLSAKVYPASYKSVLSVTSVGHMKMLNAVSSLGSLDWKDCHEEIIGDKNSAHHHNDAVDICAPGYNVPTTFLNSKYGGAWGTSFATPHVASALSLIFTMNPCLSADEAMKMVLSTADSSIYEIPQNKDYIGLLGSGRLDVYRAVSAAAESATLRLRSSEIYQMDESVESNYSIKITAPVLVKSGSSVSFKTRVDFETDSEFEVERGGEVTIDVSPDNVIICQ